MTCFTFDIEEHHRIEAAVGYDCPPALRDDYAQRMESCTRWILDALELSQAKATFFIVGQIGRTHPQLVRDIAGAGHEVGCHSWDHRNVHRLTPEEFRADLRQAVDVLSQAASAPVVGYRAPTFSITHETAWAIDVLAEEGMRYDSSVFPVRHDRYGVPDAPRFPFIVTGRERTLLEMPPVTLGIGSFNLPAAGGGYFRLFPPVIMRSAIRQVERQQGIPVLYFHPWEFDPTQPRLPLRRASRMRTYVGIRRSRPRLQRLLKDFGSQRMIDAAEKLEQAKPQLPVFRLA